MEKPIKVVTVLVVVVLLVGGLFVGGDTLLETAGDSLGLLGALLLLAFIFWLPIPLSRWHTRS